MQAVHELGHVLHAWPSGGRVQRIVLSPLEISRTDVGPNPHPQLVASGGPIWGCLLPLFVWQGMRLVNSRGTWWLRFFAGFCLIANGGYLLGGSISPVGDAEVLIQNGAPRVLLVLFGIVTTASGLALWNGQGKYFGIGRDSLPVDRSAAVGSLVALIATIALELLLNALKN